MFSPLTDGRQVTLTFKWKENFVFETGNKQVWMLFCFALIYIRSNQSDLVCFRRTVNLVLMFPDVFHRNSKTCNVSNGIESCIDAMIQDELAVLCLSV